MADIEWTVEPLYVVQLTGRVGTVKAVSRGQTYSIAVTKECGWIASRNNQPCELAKSPAFLRKAAQQLFNTAFTH